METAPTPYNRRAFIARLVGETLLDGRTVARVLDGDPGARPSTAAAVRAAARRLHLTLPEPLRPSDLHVPTGDGPERATTGSRRPPRGVSRRRDRRDRRSTSTPTPASTETSP